MSSEFRRLTSWQYLTPSMCDTSHVSSCWQCLGTSHRTPGAYHLAITYTMASKCIDLTGLLAAREQDIKEGQHTKSHLFSVCYIPIAGLLRLEYREPKARTKCKANTRHTAHALTCFDMLRSPLTWCLITWEPRALANTNCHVHRNHPQMDRKQMLPNYMFV